MLDSFYFKGRGSKEITNAAKLEIISLRSPVHT